MVRTASILLCSLLLAGCNSPHSEKQTTAQFAQADKKSGASSDQREKDAVGQIIYVPIYSHIYIRDKSRSLNLAATLSMRNTDSVRPIRISSARYYNTDGKLIKDYASAPINIAPMSTSEIVIAENDTSGGSGASFVVEWGAGARVTDPVVEAVMISSAGQQGISFVSAGRVIQNRTGQE